MHVFISLPRQFGKAEALRILSSDAAHVDTRERSGPLATTKPKKKSRKFDEREGYGNFQFRTKDASLWPAPEPGGVLLTITQNLTWGDPDAEPDVVAYYLDPQDIFDALDDLGFKSNG